MSALRLFLCGTAGGPATNRTMHSSRIAVAISTDIDESVSADGGRGTSRGASALRVVSSFHFQLLLFFYIRHPRLLVDFTVQSFHMILNQLLPFSRL